MDADTHLARNLAIGLARYVLENEEEEIDGDTIAALIYRLRIVDNYTSGDVDLICDAMRILTRKLVNLPPMTFAPEVWMPIMMAVAEGGIDPHWTSMVDSKDISNLSVPYLKDLPLPAPQTQTSTTCSEQIASTCEEHVLELGLTRRVFSAIWATDLAETTKQMGLEQWDEVHVETSEESANHTRTLFERNVFDLFAKMVDHEKFAKELLYVSLARILCKFREINPCPPHDEEDISFFESSLEIYHEVIKKMWFYVSKDRDVKKQIMKIFDKILELAPTNVLVQKCAEKFNNTCDWLKITPSDICAAMEPRLWSVVGSLVERLTYLKKSIPYEIEYSPDDFDAYCEQIPASGNKKEQFLRFMVETTCETLRTIIPFLDNAKSAKDIVAFMSKDYPNLFSSRQVLICHSAIQMYKSATEHDVIKPEDQVAVASAIIETSAIVNILAVLGCSSKDQVARKIVEKILLKISEDLLDSKRNGFVRHLHELSNFWPEMGKHADRETIVKVGKKFAEIAIESVDHQTAVLATDVFLTLLKLPLVSYPDAICNFSFAELEIAPERWTLIGNRFVEVNVTERRIENAVTLFTIHQLTTTELSLRELTYLVTQLKSLKMEEGRDLHEKFYANLEIGKILRKFLAKEALVKLAATFLDEFSDIVITNEKSLVFSLDHENLLDWLKAIDVLDSPLITRSLVKMSRAIEEWDCLMLLQLEVSECDSEDVRTFSRFWKTDAMTAMEVEDQKEIEESIAAILKEQYEKQSVVMKATREKRFNGKFPNRPVVEPWEQQLLTMHIRIAEHLTGKKVEEFEEENMFEWLVGVCSKQASYDDSTRLEAKRILARIQPQAEKRAEILYHYGISQVLNGISNGHRNGCLTMRHVFLKIYSQMVRSDMKTWKEDQSIESIDRRMGGYWNWIEDVSKANLDDDGLHISSVIQLAESFLEKKEEKSVGKFVEVVASKLEALANWTLSSGRPYHFISQLRPLLELIRCFPEVEQRHSEQIEKFYGKLFDQLFQEEFHKVVLEDEKFEVQHTDKYLSSALNTLKEYEVPMDNGFKIREVLGLFCEFGSVNVQKNCLERIAKAMETLPAQILSNEKVLNGSERIERVQQKKLVCDVSLLTECLGYVNRLYLELSETAESNEDALRALMLLDPDVHSKLEKSQRSTHTQKHRHDQIDMNFCTYKSTGNNFINQHWYNCYTCKMMESTGVCSTCAVNCHRGHELAYSKKGAFFCDCGSENCAAMESIAHFPNAMNSLRGQYPDANIKATAPKVRELFAYSFAHLSHDPGLREALQKVCGVFEKQKGEIQKILTAINLANQKALDVAEKRRCVVESMEDAEKAVEENFMSRLQSGHFLPTRRVDLLNQETSRLKSRDLAGVIKLDNGTELLVIIPECAQTCLQLHYMDTRTHLLLGMFSLRTESEPIPFNATSLHVSGNRLVVCGSFEIYALRFSPQGTVIDRAHIKLGENGGTSSSAGNLVVKAEFCKDGSHKRQLIAVATLQYVRIYDLTLHETKFIEELVLTTGNVVDFVVLPLEKDEIRALVLSNSGFLYEHLITDCTADNNSIFLTTVVNTPNGHVGTGTSLHYSHTFNLLFGSFDSGVFYTSLPEITAEILRSDATPSFQWHPLNVKSEVNTWHETSGVLGCLCDENREQIVFIHPVAGKLLTQTVAVKRPILTYFMMTSSKNQAIYAVLIFADMPTCEIWQTSWANVHDLWIEDVPSERFAIEMVESKSAPVPLEKEDLVLMAEQCEQLATIDWSSRDIEQFYTHNELNHRLSVAESMPLTIVQQTHFTMSARITNSRQIVRMIRVEVEGVNGPDALKIGNVRYSINSKGPKAFDLRLTREESMTLDHRDITIEVIPKAAQNTVKIKSLKLFGCDRSAMDEFQPIFERKPILTLPNKLVYSILEFSMLQISDKGWIEEMARNLLSRKLNHPLVATIATRALAKCHPDMDSKLFEIIDGAYLREWKGLAEWTENLAGLRILYVEQLLDRLETVRTRWSMFEKAVKKEFGTVVKFVEVMREEMRKMPLHRCQMMAQAIVKVVFGLLAQGSDEQLIDSFLDIFTDEKTYHLANDMRSAVQETISRFEHAVKEEKRILEKEEGEYVRMKASEFGAFYGVPRILKKTPENMTILKVIGEIPIGTEESTKWLEQVIAKILEKLKMDKALNSMPSVWMHISDSPSYNLSRVLASCLALCDPQVIGANFNSLIKLIKYDAEKIYPLNEETFSNYALLRSLELLLSVCLEKRAEEKEAKRKPYTEMLDQVVLELQAVGIRNLCFNVLEMVIVHWKEKGPMTFSRNLVESRKVWLPHVPLVSSSANPPNATIFNWPANAEDAYVIACTDLVLLIPQHLQEMERRKTTPQDDRWIQKLCHLAALSNGCSAYRQCKKLLLAMCHGDESKYKTMRDKYKMQDLLQQLVQKYLLVSREVGGHQQLTELVDVLTSITKLALLRPDMWRDVCSAYTIWLLRLACYTTDVVASQVVELLIVAVRDSSVGGQLSIQLADSIIEAKNGEFIEKIIKRFLIGKDEQLRWTLHGMLRSVIQLASRQNQCSIVKRLYNVVYPMTENLGVQGAQVVDLIATYAPRVFSSAELVSMTRAEIERVGRLSTKLDTDGFHGMYRLMTELGLGWKSIQFDRNPCLVCFTSKGSHEIVKLTSIRSDTRYSANTIIYKLISNYEISKVMIKLTDIKKSKSIKKVSLYYSAKSVESVDLKLHPELWRKCAVVSVGDTDTVITLSLVVPVVTSSLIIEFGEVVDSRGTSQLHCPRCSGPVRTQSGVCESCGENAFQCMKCRAINYVDREPFLCQSCGFCKYARIELSAVCRALPGAQHITSDVERGQCVQEITQLLIKMETTKAKLAGYRAVCESLYLRNRPLAPFKLHVENSHTSEFFEANGTMSLDQHSFQSITLPMNTLASAIRHLHHDLCQQTQQLMYLHEELNRYDHASEVSVVFHKPQNTAYYSTSETCFGCLCNQVLHSIALLHSSCEDENALSTILNSKGLIGSIGTLSNSYETLREESEELLVRLMFGRSDVTAMVEELIQSGHVSLSVMVKSLMYAADPTWQQKLKLLIKHAIERRDENSCLQALMVLNRYLEAAKSVPAEEKKKIRITPTSTIIQWITSSEEWKDCCSMPSTSKDPPAPSNTYQWIASCLFSQWMNVRSAANQLLVNLSRQHFHEPVALLMLCENLGKLSHLPSSVCDQFMSSAHTIIDSSVNTKARLFVQQFHVYLIKRIHEECANLHSQRVSLLGDNTFGERLRCFVELLSLLLSGSNVENVLLKAGADDLLIFLLHSTIFLKRMLTRRTRAIDSSRMALEKLLRRVSCRDGSKLMGVCVESLKLVKDASTLGIIVGVMMEIMNPQQETEETFLIQIEKDVAQEDFLQGRMTHNPYNSTDQGMGPLMRDIKNKICRDTEMIALMEDDNGMELLVAGNIISLSLSVREVYDRLWKRTNNGAPMLIVYRMRGLMGDAVETFIENFGVAEGVREEDEEDEQLVRTIQCLTPKNGGLDKLMDLLTTTNIEASSGRFLLAQLRKIFDRIVKTSSGRKALVERRVVERMMSVIRTCCADATNESKVQIGVELYKVVEFVVSDKNVHVGLTGIRESDAVWWFEMFEKRGGEEGSTSENQRKTAQILDQMMPSIGNVVLGSDESEAVFVGMFPKVLKWSQVDSDAETKRSSQKDKTMLMTEHLATITANILQSDKGNRLKQKILESGIIGTTCEYLVRDVPNLYQPTESVEWKAFLARPSLKLILTLLAGVARGHKETQKEIAKTTLKLLHRLEQVASDNSIGTLAENVIEALNEDEEVKGLITQVREETKKKKKQMAMMNRKKQLTKLGMKVGSSGEVKVSARNLHNEPSLDDTDSLVCCICRESVIRGERAAGVYAFAAIDPDTGKTGSVSMMVMVHFECHKNAIRGGGVGRAADEWTRAKLHNAGAKCNVITPIAVGIPSVVAWNEAMNRFETDVGRVSGLAHGLVNRSFVFVDMCKLIDRFIYKRSFSSQSEGGGRESNMQYLAVLHLLGCALPADGELETGSSNHRLVAFLFTELTVASWNEQKNDVLRAGLNDAQTSGIESTWEGLRPTLLTWAFVNLYFNKVIPITGEDRLEWLREHLGDTINKTLSFVQDFDTNILPCETVAEFCDVTEAPLDDVHLFLPQ